MDSSIDDIPPKIRNLTRKSVRSHLMSGRRTVTSYSSSAEEPEFESKLFLYYCSHCGNYAVIFSAPLISMPRRRTDNASAVEVGQIIKLNLDPGDPKVIKRVGGFERQYRYNCKGCGLFVAYKPDRLDVPTKYLYFLSDALASRQDLGKNICRSTMDELRAQLSSLLVQFPEGIVTPNLRPIFRKQFLTDLNESDYGSFDRLIDLLRCPELRDVIQLKPTSSGPDIHLILKAAGDDDDEK